MDSMHCYCFELLACTLLLLPLSVIDGASPATVDPCLPNPCQNSALCRSRGDGYSCFCVPGFQGVHCQIDVNECVSQPCRNGASCEDGVGRYSCVCVPGFTGATCERRIDDCHSQPCLNGGSCHDDVGGGFTCTCPPGFQGDSCENNTNECQSGPCQNGPLCIDGVNEYICDCSGRAFTGRNCETPVSPCRSEPCFNSAPCQDSGRNYTCDCWPGFSGHQCEIDIRECSSGPCAHGGRCIELSWQALYGSEPLLPQRYDQRKAAGYICSCPPGTAGTLCQELVDQCDPTPCQNGGSCESRVGGYVCHCLSQSQDGVLYGGVDCTVELVGCDSHQCQNQGSCTPFLADDTHGYSCSCPPGFTGPVCQTTTTFSFERSGYLLLQSPLGDSETSCIVTLSFRTVLPRAVLFQRHSRGLRLSLELDRGQLRLTLSKEALAGEETEMKSQSQALELPLNVTDGEWHAVEAVLDNTLLSFRLLDDTGVCESEVCNVVAPIKTALAALLSPLRTTFIGGVPEDSNSPTDIARLPAFIGCMQDVYVDWQLVVPQEWLSDSAENVSQGCSHRDRCLDVPCQNRGQCINLWQGYQCKCPRPYEGPDCEEEYVTARFGNEDSESYAAFTIADDLTHDLTVSLFLRTRRKTGLLLALANNGSQYLHMWLERGKVKVQVNNSESLEGGSGVSDGESHFVSVEVAGERMTLYVEAEEQGHVHVGTLGVRAEDLVHVGGLPERRTTSAFGGDFKGCVQDLRINDRRLQFFDLDAAVMSYPLEVMANVSAGCSGDDVCSRNPCLNGGRCFSLWDDFACTCPPHTAGWRCEEVHWCLLSPCPGDAECRLALNQGYECYSNATFLNDSSILSYRGNGVIQRNLTSVSLSLRTRNRHAAVLHAEKGPAFITLSVQDGLLFMEVHGTAGGEETREGSSMVSLSSRRMVSDGEWHSVHLFMAAPWAQTSRWTLVLDEDAEEASTSSSEGNNLNFLRQGVDIFLGGLGPEAGWTLTGCLGTVELGGIALPYFSSTEVMAPRTQDEQFVRTSQLPPLAGCSGGPVCDPDPCLNGGACQDLFNLYHCSCAEGWAGRRCDFFTDTCASGPCAHGNCSVSGTSYECDCAFGFTGDDCDEEVDVCERHLCANGGTCLHGPDRYACLCAENYTGPHCNERVEEIPWYILVRNVRPKLLVSVCGDDTRNYTCFNGGNCTERELSCDCPQGFTGHRCEQEVDECKSNPCLNGGYCRNLINKFVCVCDMSYAGDLCQTDVSDIYFYVAVLLWQNLFQLLSYLILRLDDEPEVDWGGEE